MTLHSPAHVGAPACNPRRKLLAGLAAALLLVVMVVAPPVGLATFVGNPIPGQAVVAGRLTDEAVIGMLAVVVWLAWAQLLLAVLVEAAAALRGAGLPRRLPLCGPQQLLARRLVVAIAFLLAGSTAGTASFAGTAAGTATGGSVPTACAPADPRPALAVPLMPLDVNPPAAVAPLATIGNESAAVPNASRGVAPPSPEIGLWYTVQPPHGRYHDTLWDIAERHLGDGLRWKEIYRLNKDRPQPDGESLEIANLILPGWRLLLPSDAVGIRTDVATSSDKGDPASETGHKTDRESSSPGRSTHPGAMPATATGAVVPSARTAPEVADANSNKLTANQPRTVRSGNADSNATALTGRQGRAPDRRDIDDDGSAIPFGALTLGLSALAAAGVTAELARRRRRAQRFRRPGCRLSMPDRSQTQVERQLRTANAEITATVLRDALRELAASCRRDDRALPDVHAVLLNADTITLRLGADDPVAAGPFAAASPRTWVLDQAPGAEAECEVDPDDFLDPYPALVSVGVTADAVVLVNLEAAGTLHIDGPSDAATEIACAIAAELGTSVLSSTVELVLSGCPPELAAITDAGRTQQLPAGSAARWAAGRSRAVGAALRSSALQDLADARSRRKASDLWAPAVLVDLGPRADLPKVRPYSGLCVISPRAAATEAGWSLQAEDDGWRVEPLGLNVEPQRIGAAHLTSTAGLLGTTSEDTARADVHRTPAVDPGEPGAGEQHRTVVATVRTDPPAGPADLTAIGAAIPRSPRPDGNGADGSAGLPSTAAPRVLVLGSVEVTGTATDATPGRRRRATELIAYLALHPGATQHQIDEALWPSQRVSANTRNPFVSRARQWLGAGEDDQPYLALVGEGGLYTLRPEVSCDWRDFCALSRRGLAAGADGIDDLVAALDLVRGRPFLGVNPATYVWAEADTQDMISAIVDVAHVLAELSLAAGDHRRARWAAAKGLSAEAFAEHLYQDAIRASQAAGDDADMERLIATMQHQLRELDPCDDVTDETAHLVARRGG